MIDLFDKLFVVTNLVVVAGLSLASIYFVTFSILALFYKEKPATGNQGTKSFLVLIPAYKEDTVIVETTKSALLHKTKHNFEVCVIADSLKETTNNRLKGLGVNSIRADFEKSTKVKALQLALAHTHKKFDYVIVLDADNIMAPGFINKIADSLAKGYQTVQGHRTAKNLNTDLAKLDALSEEINNSIFRKGHRAVGLSSALIGSAFACEFELFRQTISSMKAIGGFDKELEVTLLKNNIVIGYSENALVYDEKVQEPQAFTNQRRRWISAQFVYFKKYILLAISEFMLKLNFDLFNKVVQFLLPPRIIAFGILVTGTLLHLFIYLVDKNSNYQLLLPWTGVLIINSLALLLAIPGKYYKHFMLPSVLYLPNTFLLTIKAALRLKGANKNFIHTQHGITKK